MLLCFGSVGRLESSTRNAVHRISSSRAAGLAPALVVEDDPALASAIVSALHELGVRARTVTTPLDARTAIAEQAPSILIFDLTLEGDFAPWFLEELAARGALPPTVVMSGFRLGHLVAARFSVPFVRKPFEIEELLAVVAGLLGLGRSSRTSGIEA